MKPQLSLLDVWLSRIHILKSLIFDILTQEEKFHQPSGVLNSISIEISFEGIITGPCSSTVVAKSAHDRAMLELCGDLNTIVQVPGQEKS